MRCYSRSSALGACCADQSLRRVPIETSPYASRDHARAPCARASARLWSSRADGCAAEAGARRYGSEGGLQRDRAARCSGHDPARRGDARRPGDYKGYAWARFVLTTAMLGAHVSGRGDEHGDYGASTAARSIRGRPDSADVVYVANWKASAAEPAGASLPGIRYSGSAS